MSRYYKIQTAEVAVGASATSNMIVEGWDKVAIEIPTFSVYCNTAVASVHLYGYNTDQSTALPVLMESAGDGTNVSAWNVPASTGAFMATVPQAAYFKSIRVDLDGTNTTATAAMPVYLHCSMQS